MFAKFKYLIALLAISLTSCMWGATTVPEIYLKQSDMKMELNKEAYGIEALAILQIGGPQPWLAEGSPCIDD